MYIILYLVLDRVFSVVNGKMECSSGRENVKNTAWRSIQNKLPRIILLLLHASSTLL